MDLPGARTTMTELTALDVLGEGGVLAQALDHYEKRPAQEEYALAISNAFTNEKNMMAEAGTGTGKSFGYLVPAILHATRKGQCVVVATANIALQEQLNEKDLPFLKEVLPIDFSFGLLKGKNNYICLNQLEHQKKIMFGKGDVEKQIEKWAEITETGDKSELEIEPPSAIWRHYSVTSEECINCELRKGCFSKRARQQVVESDIIVCNYHLLFAHVKVKMDTGMDLVLPEFSILICDEGHKLTDIARSFFGWEMSGSATNRLRKKLLSVIKEAAKAVNKSERLGKQKTLDNMRKDVDQLGKASEKLFKNLERIHGTKRGGTKIRKNILKGAAFINALREAGNDFSLLKEVNYKMDKSDISAECKKKRNLAFKLAEQLEEAEKLEDKMAVYFTEQMGQSKIIKLVKRKIDVASDLRNNLFKDRTSIITSATLAVEGRCSYIKNGMGLGDAKEIIVGSPFDFEKQCAIVVSSQAPNPKEQGYIEKLGKIVEFIIDEMKGRTLGLFTSYKNLNAVRDYLMEHNPNGYTLLCQGDAPKMKLIAKFKEDVSSVLLGTESFWSGVDVPGEALSCLIIDKLPFRSPGDPVWDELCARDENWFWNLAIPAAVIQLKQGCGRLIRRKTDKGVIVILDNRLATKGYGNKFASSLPPMTMIKSLKGMSDFLR